MNFLLDTHVLRWWLDDDPSLSGKARSVIANGERLVFVSAATYLGDQDQRGIGQVTGPTEFSGGIRGPVL